ncbi:class I SAM-dependent RNA methyltransferase [Propionicimonas sp.]|uniref:class I SAM-dependent RNA methyltransferase n=1 Tax=Propionicimonas sp. TaxID=1955623 RepID=UPI0017AFBA76|nr:TRAM domain-containing protein [Propionicimonas sp.]MBU3977278.1 TRAM domain-containing protein [Actinomycetota bacterium]MBA3021203.1 class I SAM-dependent RNA methyltransferase [Propionicimonas sp.]MBU3985788.1 TRAM domain-containing protein [Actinomycetota bacterium]MBU4008573.1 TRAM domain-containing protein [Actinomycetota bacterium]MBU4066277.1 TRAM domain-containing protein [Actinomycetota bacterium]
MSLEVGQVLRSVEIGPVAHGGHFVTRYSGQVVFVRGGLTGELADVEVTEANRKYARGEVVSVQRASEHRVEPPCPIAGSCGGCDFQHVELAHTRELKRQVVAELLGHLGDYDFQGQVLEVAPAPFGWRTRMRYQHDGTGRLGLMEHRSRQVVPLPAQGCLLAVPQLAYPKVAHRAPAEVVAVAAASGLVVVGGDVVGSTVTEEVLGHEFTVEATGFWQAHRGAPAALVAAVLAGLEPAAGERAADLYCGSGLFASFLAEAGCQVLGIEGDRRATELARQNVPVGEFIQGDVAKLVDRLPLTLDVAVLDPPRVGAGDAVLTALLARHPRAVAYIACDPAALGRDLRIAASCGYQVASVTAFDLFPLTHHVECVAILKPA